MSVRISNTQSLNYSDVNLIAQPGKVASRRGIPIEGKRIVVSAMSSIVGVEFIKAVGALPDDLQPTIHIPRVTNIEELLQTAKDSGCKNIFVGVGISTPDIEDLAEKYGFKDVLLDVANGYAPNVIEAVGRLSKRFDNVIVGSVHTQEGMKNLVDAGATIVRSGIGPGSVCITKDSTGYTRGTFTEIVDLGAGKEKFSTQLLADGGFRGTSDLVKAYLAGADYIMGGRIFVDAAEAELRVTEDEELKDVYYGMASAFGKRRMGKKVEYVEGKLDRLSRDNVKPLKEILETIWQGIQSGVSYSGYATLEEAIGNGVFEIKHQR